MRWSWKIGEITGIGIYVHATFLLIIGWVALSHWLQGHDFKTTLTGVVFIGAIFGCVVLHELGHALAARKFGIRTRDITLLPIGGVAHLERVPEEPRQELWVSLAGPAVNVAIAALLFLWLNLTSSYVPISELTVSSGSFAERLMIVNLFLVGFNMLPAFPMDGGRVLRAFLANRIEYARATRIAAGIGQGMAFIFGFAGLFTNPFLLFIAFFVWIGAAQESGMVTLKSVLRGIPVHRAMLTDYRTLSINDTLEQAQTFILTGSQQDFPVVNETASVVGVLTKRDLLVGLMKYGATGLVSETMQREFQIVDAQELLESAYLRLQGCKCHTLPVENNGKLVGLLTMENVGELILVQSALHERQKRLNRTEV